MNLCDTKISLESVKVIATFKYDENKRKIITILRNLIIMDSR